MLGSAIVVGPVSPCNSAVRVQNQVAGATVDVFAVRIAPGQTTSRLVAASVVNSADAMVPLLTGAALHPGERLTVICHRQGTTSPGF